MTGTIPTPVIDKNGRATTVHKNPEESAGAANSRVAGLNAKPAEKRTPFKLGKYDSAQWKESDTVELGTKDDSGRQNIFFNGRVIGSVTSSQQRSERKIKGSRLVSRGAMETKWRANEYHAEDRVLVGNDSGYSRESRSDAVSSYVNSYLENIVQNAENKDFIANGGISFRSTGTYHDPKLSVNDTEIKLPQGYTFSFNSAGGGQFYLRTEVVISSPSERVEISPNHDSYDGEVAYVSIRSQNDHTTRYFDLSEKGEITASDPDSAVWVKDNEKVFNNIQSITQQIAEARAQ